MRYEQYYRFIFKLKKIRDYFHHYRFLIFALTGTAVITSSTLFSIKGWINGEVLFANTITYGESYQPKGTAIFEEVTYEYAAVNTEQWDETAPIRVGSYQVRGKAKNNFNDYYYGKTYYYSIIPKPIVVNFVDTAVVYGDKPRISLPLIYGDQVSEYIIDVEDYSERETRIEIDLSKLKIIDASGEDVTFCYTITQESIPFTFFPRPIEFRFKGGEKIYDGTPLFNDDYEVIGDLVVGDEFELDPSLMQTGLGSTINQRQVRFFNQTGLDVSHLYQVTTGKSETLLVTQRPLTLQSNSPNKMYDGLAFSDEEFFLETVSGNLLPGHRLETTFLQSTEFLVGDNQNEFNVIIFNEANEIVTDVYDLEREFGLFSITPRPITVTANSSQRAYNGTPLQDDGYTITAGELAPLDQIKPFCENSIVTVGEISNTCTFEIIHSSGVDVTNSYDLNAIPGQLLIGQRPLTIQLPNRQKVYDGTPLVVDDFTYDERQIAEGHTLILDRWTSVINAGTYDHDFEWTIVDSQGVPVTSNYELQVLGVENAVTIDKRPLSMKTKSVSKTYDAKASLSNMPLTPLTKNQYKDWFDVISGDLADDQQIRVLNATNLTNVGTVPNVVEVVIENDQGNIVTSNYDLSIEMGTLSVDAFRSLTLVSTSENKTYDDKIFTSTTHYQSSPENLFENDYISDIRMTSAQVDAGSSEIVIDPSSIVIRNKQGEIITDNYDLIILANQGQLTVEKRPLNVRINSQQKIYDGLPLVSNQPATILNPTTIVDGHSLQVTSGLTPPVSVTDYDNGKTTPTNSIAKVFRGNVDVTGNYNVNVEEGTLKINQRAISVETNGGEKVYDGTPLTTFTPTLSTSAGSATLVMGHQFVTTFDKEGHQPTEVFDKYGESYINSATFKIIDTFNQNRDVTFNYSINKITFGKVQITKRPITLSVIPLKLEYNGKVQGYNTPKSTISPRASGDSNPVYLTAGSLPDGFRLETGLKLQATAAGEYLNNFELVDLKFYNEANQSINQNNFDITRRFGITIQKRFITISSLSGEKSEDGLSFPKTKEISQGQLAEGHTIFYPETPDMIVARTEPYVNEIYPPTIYDEFMRDVTSNYEINYQKGEVFIFKA